MEPKKNGKRMSVSFTASQAAALERASLATGATQASILAIALDEWLRDHGDRRAVAEEIPYGDGGVALVIGGQAWAGCDAADLQAAWRAWQAMTPDEHARWREDPGFRPLGDK